MIHLYVKTHNITGLKYMGKTVQDPLKYKGSGKYWLSHLKKHGNDVSTVVIGSFATEEDFRSTSLKLSEQLDIVNSPEWANLRPEDGSGGDTSAFINYTNLDRGKGLTYEQRYGQEKATALKHQRSIQMTKTRKGKTLEQISGVDKAAHLKSLASQRMIKRNTGATHSELTRSKISNSHKGKRYALFSCICCHRILPVNNITQHFQSCSK